MNLGICDDDITYGTHLANLCRRISYIDRVDYYETADALLKAIDNGLIYDALLMDIVFHSEKTGIDYMRDLYEKHPHIHVIYVTAHTDRFVSKVFLQQSRLSGFLSKPVTETMLSETLEHLYKKICSDRNCLIIYNGKRPSSTIPVSDILYLESDAHKTHIYLDIEQDNCRLSTYERLAVLGKRLPPSFHACHKSYVVNMDKIIRIERNEVLLKGNVSISVSKSHYMKLRERYFHYIQSKL